VHAVLAHVAEDHHAAVIDLGAGGDGLKNQRTHQRQRRDRRFLL